MNAPHRLHVHVVTLFPAMIREAAAWSILGRAQASGHLQLGTVDPRDFTTDRHRSADDYPFGGGAGMVMKPEPLVAAIESIAPPSSGIPVLLTAPDGTRFDQSMAHRLASLPRFVLVCGHYEGVDERVRDGWITEEVSLGDYVLTGGEPAAIVILDAVARLVPGVLGNAESSVDESFGDGLLEHPQYTRPAEFRGRHVPEVLLNGHHARIAAWRRTQSLVRTRERRPDLWDIMLPLSKRDRDLLSRHDTELQARALEVREVDPEGPTNAATNVVVVSEPVSTPAPPEPTSGGSAEPVSIVVTKSDSET